MDRLPWWAMLILILLITVVIPVVIQLVIGAAIGFPAHEEIGPGGSGWLNG